MKKLLISLGLLLSPMLCKAGSIDYGIASWYGNGFHGRKTASGETFNQHGRTVASNILPLGTRVKITCMVTKKSVVARVNDRGGFHKYGRKMDLSRGTADAIGLTKLGISRIKYEVLN